MHLLRSTSIGTEIIDNIDHHVHGTVADLLIDPDRGKIVALLIAAPASSELLALQTADITTWGNRIHVREPEVLGPATDFVRLQSLLQEKRTFVGQRIQTKSGASIGKCIDVQFRSDTFDIEWIFPRKFFKKGLALPTSDILEVTERAIIVKEQGAKEEKVEAEEEVLAAELETAASPAASRQARRSGSR